MKRFIGRVLVFASMAGCASRAGATEGESTTGLSDSTTGDTYSTETDSTTGPDGENVDGMLAAGSNHTCARLETGAIRCWGWGGQGQLGYGNTENVGDDETPASAGDVDVGGTVVELAAGAAHTCALLDTGHVRCWGFGAFGQLGYGNTDSITEPPSSAGDVDVGGTVVELAAGYTHTCALLETGNVRCWGWGIEGELGYGNIETIGDDETPASVGDVDVGAAVLDVAAGGDHTCALLETGNVRCWGAPILGYGNTNNIGDDETPASAGDIDVGGPALEIDVGSTVICARLEFGNVRCWGSTGLGYGNTMVIGDDEMPASAGDIDIGGVVVEIAVGDFHACARLDTGDVRCWGIASSGQIGYGNTNEIGDDETPAFAGNVDVGGAVVELCAKGDHTCARLTTGGVRCWGSAFYGQLGYGNNFPIGDDETPASAGDVPIFF